MQLGNSLQHSFPLYRESIMAKALVADFGSVVECLLLMCTAAQVLFPVWRQHLGCTQGLCRVLCSGVDRLFASCKAFRTVTALHQSYLRPVTLGMPNNQFLIQQDSQRPVAFYILS